MMRVKDWLELIEPSLKTGTWHFSKSAALAYKSVLEIRDDSGRCPLCHFAYSVDPKIDYCGAWWFALRDAGFDDGGTYSRRNLEAIARAADYDFATLPKRLHPVRRALLGMCGLPKDTDNAA